MKQSSLSQSQLGIYLGSAYREDLAYHIAYAFRFSADTDPERLQAAVRKVLACHPAFNVAIATDENGEARMEWDGATLPDVPVRTATDAEFEEIKAGVLSHIDVPGDRMCRLEVIRAESHVWLTMVIHHIIYDGSSMRVFLRDLDIALKGGEIEPEAVDCFSLAERETAARSGAEYESQREYYVRTFGDFDTDGAALYSDAKGVEQQFSHKVFRLATPLSRFKGNSAVANAAMGIALGAFTGRDDVLFTTIYHGRNTHDTDNTVGMIVRTLPVRCHLGKDVTAQALVAEMKEQRRDTRAKDLFSFADFSSMTGYEQNVLFGYQGRLLDMDSLVEGMVPERLDNGDTGVPVSIQMFLADDGVDVDVIWRSDIYTEATVDRLVRTLDLALDQLCDPANAESAVSSFRLTDAAADAELKDMESAPALDFDRSVPIEGAIAALAREIPDKTALVAPDASYTYAEIDRLSTVMAHNLKAAGVTPGMAVGVMIPRSQWMVLIPLALMKAGAAYMPLDPSFPEERLTFMTGDAGVTFIVTTGGLAGRTLPGFAGTILDAGALTQGEAAPVDEWPANPDGSFVILYTSGSTGKPKGVTLTRANLLNFCHDYMHLVPLGQEDRVPAYANFGFDAHMMDLYPTLMSGATLYILDEELRHDLDAMHDFFVKTGITAAFLTTQIAWQMITLYEFPSLRWLACGGEKLPPVGRLPFAFANAYGPTECSVFATCYMPQGETDGTVIGRPIPGYEVRVLDRYGRRVPRGVPGELVILGVSVAVGYLNRPELTAEKFITIDGVRAYRTGDLVRWNEDGDIQFMGRMDGMVKLRGLRIELGEIEAVATRHEAVRQFAAAVKSVGGNDQLVGYYAVKEGMDVSPEELRDFMSADLTEFMIPAAVMKLDSLPMNQNGKIDRKALPLPEIEVAEETVPPATDDEREMTEIVAGVLGHDSFGVTTNLLKVGLTSLLAMRLVATIAKKRDVRMTSKAAMADPTVRGLIKALEQASAATSAAPAKTAAKRKYYPITENQRGVLIDWERNRDALQYNVAQAIRIKRDTDLERLKKAIAEAVKAHPALGARFVNRNGDIMQQRMKVENVEVDEITLDHAPERADMQALVRPFDLFAEPLYRFAIVRHADDAWLFMDFHHIVFDGVSAMVFFDSLSRAYAGQNLAEEEYSAFEWADDEAALLRGAEYEEAEEWFDRLLGEAETTVYSHSSSPEAVPQGTLLRVAAELDAADIDRFCSDNAVTPSNFFLSAFMQTLHRLTRNETLAITTVNNGRSDVRLIDDIGMFVKTLPVVSRVSPAQAAKTTPAQMALELQNQFNTTRGYDFYPFTEIVRRFGLRPEIMYVYEGGVSLDAADGPLSDEKIPVALDTAKVPLTLLIFTPAPGKYRLELEYDASLYSNADMAVLLDMVGSAASGNVCAATVREAALLSPAKDVELEPIRDGECGDVPYTSYHGAFELQADACPDRLALVARDRSLTYAELDAEANRIANALRANGVERGDKVVVLLPRDSRLIAAIYGVMKTGAAYIPCDPEYPVERIKLITEDSDAKWIVTTATRLDSFPGKAIDIDTLLACPDASRPGVEIEPDDPAYLIYTSGSTGRPKGVVIHHGAAVNYLYGYRKLIYSPMGADEPKVNMLIVTISFDASHVDLGTSLTSGHTLVLADEEECKDVAMLADLMKRTGVEAFDATPSRLAAMLELPEFCEAIAGCKLLNIGGEAIPASLLPKLDSAGFRGLIVNEYGPTETTVGSNHAVLQSGKPVTVGPPFYNYREYICDAWGGELPVGAIGELVIAGRSVGKGYHNLPEKTAESFITFREAPAYRTGDLARWLPDGDIDVLGRIDHQVKLRGLRIELGEIESVANAFPGVKMSVANVCRIQNIDHLCIWYEGQDVNQEELRAHLTRHLTDYMVPDSFNPVDKIPVTPNGKLDRKHLPEPVLEKLAEYVEPAPGDEAAIAEAFRRTLGLERVGANDDFFKIGGTSINAIKVVAVLSQSGLKISYKDLFATKTPRALAAHLSETPQTAAPAAGTCAAETPAEEFGDILRKNTIAAFNDGELQSVGNVLLTGATGFLGVHVLHWLLDATDARVYCVVRGSKSFDASSRVRTLLFYYFGDTYEHLWDKRIFIVTGDLTEAATLAALDASAIDTVINCAASVKHFAPGNEIEHANVDTVRNIVDWCAAHDRRLVHISTVSVAGDAEASVAAAKVLTEQSLDLGQGLSNQYVKSKYDAEKIILGAIAEDRIQAKIMRVGNISPRESDGEFQANFQSNAFMGMLRAYLALGCIPYSHLDSSCEFSPVDQLSWSILRLATTPTDNVVFHPLNNHHVPMADVIGVMNEVLPKKIECVEPGLFAARLNEAMASGSDVVTLLQPLVAYQSADGNTAYIGCSPKFTNEILFRLDFRWSPTSTAYIRNFITAIAGLGYFDAAMAPE
ncbi:MAG: amino acid adenylation domain-containing protein [Muribaculaceae bacterium]|nr:amino acid adenylation domain-containing protein [Muribaculaceae bacterium]